MISGSFLAAKNKAKAKGSAKVRLVESLDEESSLNSCFALFRQLADADRWDQRTKENQRYSRVT